MNKKGPPGGLVDRKPDGSIILDKDADRRDEELLDEAIERAKRAAEQQQRRKRAG